MLVPPSVTCIPITKQAYNYCINTANTNGLKNSKLQKAYSWKLYRGYCNISTAQNDMRSIVHPKAAVRCAIFNQSARNEYNDFISTAQKLIAAVTLECCHFHAITFRVYEFELFHINSCC